MNLNFEKIQKLSSIFSIIVLCLITLSASLTAYAQTYLPTGVTAPPAPPVTEVNQIITTFMPIEQAMRKCALPTALGGINQMRALFPEYDDIFAYVSSELSNYLDSEG